jgi:hypothetical protein
MSTFDQRARVLTGQLWEEAMTSEVPPPFPLTDNEVEQMLHNIKQGTSLANEIVFVASSNVGYGEVEGNNDGPLIRAMGGKPGQEWCALFAGHCYERAHKRLGVTMPFQRSTGAKRLVKNLAAVGRFFTDPLEARPGDLVCWHRRTGLISWKGHVGIVEKVDPDGIIHTIEGNVGAFPAKVRRLSHDVRKERLYGFASLTKGK